MTTAPRPSADRPLLRAALVHIQRHLAEPLPLTAVGRAVGCSPFRLVRTFRAALGVGPAEYIRRARLKRASLALAFRLDRPVSALALESGYASPEAFARAFRRVVGQSPSAFRRRPAWERWRRAFDLPEAAAQLGRQRHVDPAAVRVVTRGPTPVAALEHRGPAHTVGDTLRRFIAWRKRQRGLGPRACATYNLLHRADGADPAGLLHLDVCVATPRRLTPADADAGIVAKVVPGGRFATLRVVGTDAALRSGVDFLVHTWLPASGATARDVPVVLHRRALFPDVAEHEAVTDVLLAID
jgi:AraC family transcriptional regulator